MGFGGGGGYYHDGPTVWPYRRFDDFHPEYNIERPVFPHTVPAYAITPEIERAAKRAGLEPVHVWDGPWDTGPVDQILLELDPWNPGLRPTQPDGYYPGATGATSYDATCWRRKRPIVGQIHLSHVTWSFYEAGDYATSIGARVVPTYSGPAELLKTADKIVDRLAKWLESHRPDPGKWLRKGIRVQASRADAPPRVDPRSAGSDEWVGFVTGEDLRFN